ncbi:hypothetical protein [Mycobacterium ostraviense]|uniref:Uncharacterized protein n=1 Tax=Mycobacterium ostraviense TaxID=2738409 RepID=A0A164EKD5_9MYCO|nr:hypothetical protein [Mycobacterium ostraviense]KZS67634.1 hypothetical protein A4G28_14175 [Mycobacterium ostraviense]UGT91328.1 hypothetical protein LTS72_24680 [Mycobacterium ostraviense]
MSKHYVAHREEHAEQAVLATRRLKAAVTAVTFFREDRDGMHSFDRADRFLPHGYCLLPPLQTYDKRSAFRRSLEDRDGSVLVPCDAL